MALTGKWWRTVGNGIPRGLVVLGEADREPREIGELPCAFSVDVPLRHLFFHKLVSALSVMLLHEQAPGDSFAVKQVMPC